MSLFTGSIREIGDARALDVAVVDGLGAQLTGFDPSRPANAGITTVSVDNTVGGTSLLVANPARRQFIVHNDSAGTIFVALAATASATAFTYEVAGNSTIEGPLNGYTGAISAFRVSGVSAVRVTEVTT